MRVLKDIVVVISVSFCMCAAIVGFASVLDYLTITVANAYNNWYAQEIYPNMP